MQEKRDIYNTIDNYKRELRNLFQWKIGNDNKKLIISFLRRSELDNISLVQRWKYIHSIKTLLRFKVKRFDEYTKDDMMNFLLFMKQYSLGTQIIRWSSIMKFFTFIGREEIVEDIKPRMRSKNIKLPEELLTRDEIRKLISQAHHIRNKAFIAVLYEGGFRIGELLSRKIKHIEFDRYGGVIIVDGKTGMRRVRLIESIPLLANWIANHPLNNDSNASLWIDIVNYNRPISYHAFSRMMKKLVMKCGINKRVHMHLFRHSRATELAKKLTEQQLKIYLGWTQASEMASVYVHLSGRDVDNAILELNGIEIDEHKGDEKKKSFNCFRCSNVCSSFSKFCNKCGMAFDLKEIITQHQE